MFYFAYSVDMEEEHLRRRAPSARFLRAARLPGARPDFFEYVPESVVIDVVPDDKGEVWGGLYFVEDGEFPFLKEPFEPGKTGRFRPVWDERAAAFHAWMFEGAGGVPASLPPKAYVEKIANLALCCKIPAKYVGLIQSWKTKG